MKTYHIYIFDYTESAIFYKNTEYVDKNKTNAINDDGSWNFEVLVSELGFTSNIEYLVSEKPLEIIDLW